MSDLQAPLRATVIDAGVGNLGNLVRALRHLGADTELTTDPELVAGARCLVLPGVGAFRPPRERLRGELEDALRRALDTGAHLLGICVGFQLLFESSVEFGDTDGLGLLPGTVQKLPDDVSLPQIGWNRLVGKQLLAGSDHPLLDGLGDEAFFYFVHSYAPLPEDPVDEARHGTVPEDVVLARAVHGRPFVAVAGRGRVLGTQFHPEKSGDDGLRLLRNYLHLAHRDAS